MLGLRATPSGDALELAREKLESAHGLLKSQGLVRWTLADVPQELYEAYILCTAALLAGEYGAAVDPSWWPAGLRMVQIHVHVPLSGPSSVENF